jgi:hypothetical protein
MIDTPEKSTENDTPELVETENEVATRALIFQSQDCKEVLVPVPEWGTSVLIRALTGTRRSEFLAFNSALLKEHRDTPEFYKRIMFEQIRLGCVHPRTKKPIFTFADRDTLMGEHNGAVIQVLAAMVREISDLTTDTAEQAKKKLQSIRSGSITTNLLNGSTANI